MNITYAFADSQAEWNTSEWRGHIPSNGLNTHPEHEGRMIPMGEFSAYGHDVVQSVVGQADVIVVQRNLITPDIWEACDYWRGLGKTVVADLDDDYPHLTPQNPAYRFWILDAAKLNDRIGKTPVEALREGFKHVDALISPNENILADWADIVPGYWVPNYAHWPWYKDIKQKPTPTGDEPIIIGWGGSVSHYDSWWFSGLRDAVPVITEKYPNVVWKICGGDVRVKNFFKQLGEDRWIDQRGVGPEVWPQQVASFDIGLAPLCGPGYPQGERYDLRRSWLKAVEYLLTGVPWIASGEGVYGKLDGQGGFVVENTPEAWQAALEEVINSLDEYKTASKNMLPWARDNLSMPHVVDKYVKTFTDIMSDKAIEMGSRLPNVFYSEDVFDSTEDIGVIEVTMSDDDLPALTEIQQNNYTLSMAWHDALDIVYSGVDLASCLQYPFLQTVNAITYEESESG